MLLLILPLLILNNNSTNNSNNSSIKLINSLILENRAVRVGKIYLKLGVMSVVINLPLMEDKLFTILMILKTYLNMNLIEGREIVCLTVVMYSSIPQKEKTRIITPIIIIFWFNRNLHRLRDLYLNIRLMDSRKKGLIIIFLFLYFTL